VSRNEKLQVALFGSGLLLIWVGVQLSYTWIFASAVVLIGAGIVLGGYQLLATASQLSQGPDWEPTRSQKVVASIQGMLHVGIGLAMILGSIMAALVGPEVLWQFLSKQHGLIYFALGAVLTAMSVQVALGEGQARQSGWELLASMPLRLASLPMFLIGLAFLAIGTFALFIPNLFNTWIHAVLGPFITGR
jgi:hypothetical protein